MPKPPTRQTPTPRYELDQVLPDAGFSIKRYQLRFKGYRGELIMRPELARKICKLLNASRSKGKP